MFRNFLMLILCIISLSCSSDDSSNNGIVTNINSTDKRISKYTRVFADNNKSYEYTFNYNSLNRLNKIDVNSFDNGVLTESASLIINYTNELITSAIASQNGTTITNIDIEYNNDQLTKITSTNVSSNEFQSYDYNYTNNIIASYDYLTTGNSASINYAYTFNNENLTRIIDNGDETTFTYDDKKNPFNYFSQAELLIIRTALSKVEISKNNILTQTTVYNINTSNPVTDNYNLTYNYDIDDYPTTKTVTRIFLDGSTQLKDTFYFEY